MQVLQAVVEEEIKKKCAYGERCLGGSECIKWLPCSEAGRKLRILMNLLLEDELTGRVIISYGVHIHFINRNDISQQVLFSAAIRDGRVVFNQRILDMQLGWSRSPVYELFVEGK